MRIEVEVSRGHVFAQVGRWSLFLPLFSRQVWRLHGVSAGLDPRRFPAQAPAVTPRKPPQ